MNKAPLFHLNDQYGEPFSLEEALKSGPLVVFFYPKDHTRVCSREVRGFHFLHDRFKDLGAQIVGISSDDEKTHLEFSKTCGPSIRLLSDLGGNVRKAFKVRAHMILIPGRETFVIDQDRNIVQNIRNLSDHDAHIDGAVNALKALNN